MPTTFTNGKLVLVGADGTIYENLFAVQESEGKSSGPQLKLPVSG